MSELLPCPWCGQQLKETVVTEGSTFRWRKVEGCCADGPEVRHDTMAQDQVAAEADSRKRAIEAWNTRAPVATPPPPSVVERDARNDPHTDCPLRELYRRDGNIVAECMTHGGKSEWSPEQWAARLKDGA